MTVAYEEYWAKAFEAVINLVADGATFTTLVSPASPKDRIIEIDGGPEDENTPTARACTGNTFARASAALLAHVGPEAPDLQYTWNAPQSITGDGMIPVAFYWRPTGITYRHELLRYVISKTGLIARDIMNQQGQTGKWRKIVAQFAGVQFQDTAGHNRVAIRSQLNIQFGDLP